MSPQLPPALPRAEAAGAAGLAPFALVDRLLVCEDTAAVDGCGGGLGVPPSPDASRQRGGEASEPRRAREAALPAAIAVHAGELCLEMFLTPAATAAAEQAAAEACAAAEAIGDDDNGRHGDPAAARGSGDHGLGARPSALAGCASDASGGGEQPTSGQRSRSGPHTGAGRQRAMRSVKDIGAEASVKTNQPPPSPANGLPAPLAEVAAAGSISVTCSQFPASTAATASEPGVTAEDGVAPSAGATAAVSPGPSPKKQARLCRYCRFHGIVSASSPAHSASCQFANRCFCFDCTRIGWRNGDNTAAARKRKLAAVAAPDA